MCQTFVRCMLNTTCFYTGSNSSVEQSNKQSFRLVFEPDMIDKRYAVKDKVLSIIKDAQDFKECKKLMRKKSTTEC